MRKGLSKKIVITILLVVCIAVFFACDASDDYPFPKDRTAERIVVYCRENGNQVEVEGENLRRLETDLKLLERFVPERHTEYKQSLGYDFVITVTLAKKGLKKSRTYSLDVGLYSATAYFGDGDELTSSKALVKKDGGESEATTAFINFLYELTR